MLVTTQVKQNAEAIARFEICKEWLRCVRQCYHIEIFPLLIVKCSKFYICFDGIRTLYGFGFSFMFVLQ
jgi:hypothetical protein